MEERIEVMGVKVNIWKGGTGEPLFFFSGWNGAFADIKHLLDAISSRNFAVYGVEFPGSGKSDFPTREWSFDAFVALAKEVFDYYGVDRAVVLGHSFGSIIALKFARRFPSGLKRLVIANSPVLSKKHWILRHIFGAGFLLFVLVLKPLSWGMIILKWIAQIFLLHRIWRFLGSSNMLSKIHQFNRLYYYLTHSKGVMRRIFERFVEDDTVEDARQVRAPTLIVWAERGGVTPVSNSKALREVIPNNEFVVIPSADHHFRGEAAERFADIIAEWVKK